MTDLKPAGSTPRWAIAGLILIMAFNVWWRWHTIGPTPLDRPFEGSLVRSGETEPLDCDESAYAYMGRRMLRGDVLYRDLTENKPPLGYWLYGLAVALGGANEPTIRLMPIPYILATIGMVWYLGLRLGYPASACLAALVFAVTDTDPYIFGNGSNLEHFLNFFSVASLVFLLRAREADTARIAGRRGLLLAGVCLGLAALVKQVAVTHGLVYAVFLLLPSGSGSRTILSRVVEVAILGLGFVLPCLVAFGILLAQGAGRAAYEDMVLFARALTTDVPVSPNAPPRLVRWVTGNADPEGKLPWPFGKTRYYAWWGAGLWPLWLTSLPATARLVFDRTQQSAARRLLAAWTASAWVQVLLPGLFWQHYYLLPVPGVALAVSLWLVDALKGIRSRPIPSTIVVLGLLVALGWSSRIQVRDYLGLTPGEITSEFKGGRQWVELRKFGRDLADRSRVWDDPHLFVWGWQSPLFIYSGLDGVSRHFFANELLKAHANDDHPLIRPWIEEILRDLKARTPALILCGDVPFPALRKFLNERYLPSRLSPIAPDGRGLWVEKGRYAEFHAPPTSVRR